MVITNDFVFLHYPKTGGTFCETHIKRLYQQNNRKRLANLIRRRPVRWYRSFRQHSGVHAVPRYALRLPKVSSIRNPYDRWVSHYEFKIYANYPEVVPNLEKIEKEYPHFPDVTFTEFVKLVNKYYNKVQNQVGKTEEEKIGFYSAQFIGMFCPQPREILALPRAEITADLVRNKLAPNITFLMTHNLNQELYDYLAQFNHDTAELEDILQSPKILPEKEGVAPRPKKSAWRTYYTEEAVQIINDKEALLFDLFPQFEVESYDKSWQYRPSGELQ